MSEITLAPEVMKIIGEIMAQALEELRQCSDSLASISAALSQRAAAPCSCRAPASHPRAGHRASDGPGLTLDGLKKKCQEIAARGIEARAALIAAIKTLAADGKLSSVKPGNYAELFEKLNEIQ